MQKDQAYFEKKLKEIETHITNADFTLASAVTDQLIRDFDTITVDPKNLHLIVQAKAHLDGIQEIIQRAQADRTIN